MLFALHETKLMMTMTVSLILVFFVCTITVCISIIGYLYVIQCLYIHIPTLWAWLILVSLIV